MTLIKMGENYMTSSQASFPRWLLHLSGDEKNSPWAQYWLGTWKDKNAEWKPVPIIWTPEQCATFVRTVFPWLAPVYDAYPDETCRRQVVKYLFAFTYGGMIVEPTMECTQSVAGLRSVGVDVLLGSLDDHLQTAYSLPADFILSMPRATFWLYVLEFLMYPDMWPGGQFEAANGAIDLTGSRALRLAYLETQKTPPTPWTGLRVARLHFLKDGGATSIPAEAWQAAAAGTPELSVPAPLQLGWGLSPIPSRIGVMGPKALFPLDWQNRTHAQFQLQFTRTNIFEKTKDESKGEDVQLALRQQTRLMRATFPHAYAVNYWFNVDKF